MVVFCENSSVVYHFLAYFARIISSTSVPCFGALDCCAPSGVRAKRARAAGRSRRVSIGTVLWSGVSGVPLEYAEPGGGFPAPFLPGPNLQAIPAPPITP